MKCQVTAISNNPTNGESLSARCVLDAGHQGNHRFNANDFSPSTKEHEAERSELPLRETFALLPAAEVEELKSQLRDARQREQELQHDVARTGYALQQLRLKYALCDAELPVDFEPELEPSERITKYVQATEQREQEMRGKLVIAKRMFCEAADMAYAIKALDDLIAAIPPKESSNGK